ncbi:MAG: iron-only hydrogenase system regulator [Firmicutes bacterium]|nr:iron-only hydrogenase system regulator [Bacillota bacterium]
MENKVAIIAIIVKNGSSVEEVNSLLHQYSERIIGRMGVPYREKGVNIISIAIDAPMDEINTLAGLIGRVEGVSAKTVTANV